jgi:chromosome segregation ATPase
VADLQREQRKTTEEEAAHQVTRDQMLAYETELSELKAKWRAQLSELERLERELAAFRLEIDRLKRELAALRATRDTSADAERCRADAARLQAELDAANAAARDRDAEFDRVHREVAVLEADLAALRSAPIKIAACKDCTNRLTVPIAELDLVQCSLLLGWCVC